MSKLVDFPVPDRSLTQIDRDKIHSEAFRDLEGEICDCANMASIAAQMMTENDGADDEMLFAVTHVFQMLTELKANYYAAWYGEKRKDAP
jgi:hypothetical protein